MRVVFMGTPEFGVPSLRALARHHDVLAAYTRPDAASGRGPAKRPSAVKIAAEELAIPVRQPSTLRDAAEQSSFASLGADVVAVAAYGLILPRAVLEAAPLGAVNVHGSLLPRWRGAAPIQRAILAGDSATGVSIMRMEEGLDTGPFCRQTAIEIDGRSASELTGLVAVLGAESLVQALPSIADGSAVWIEQDEALATYAEKVTKDDVRIAPGMSAQDASRRVRASMPASPSRVTIAGRGVALLDASASDSAVLQGSVEVTTTALLLGVSDGAIEVRRLKPDGKNEMDAVAWVRGIKSLDGADWDRAR